MPLFRLASLCLALFVGFSPVLADEDLDQKLAPPRLVLLSQIDYLTRNVDSLSDDNTAKAKLSALLSQARTLANEGRWEEAERLYVEAMRGAFPFQGGVQDTVDKLRQDLQTYVNRKWVPRTQVKIS